MATLIENKDKVWKQRKDEDFMGFMNRTDTELEKLMKENDVIQIPYADGYAFYEVVSKKPLKLKHLPAGDAWEVPYSQIRGLRLADIEEMLDYKKSIKNYFKPLSSIY